MRRYGFLTKKDTYEALNSLRDAFLAAKDGNEVNEVMNGILTEDERIKIGRRILIAECLTYKWTYKELSDMSNVGRSTIVWVAKQVASYPLCFQLLFKRHRKLEEEYQNKKFRKLRSSFHLYEKKEYTGLKRSDIKR